MRDKRAPKFLKLQKFKLIDERSKILFAVALHFALLNREIDVTGSYSAFEHSLNKFLDQYLEHYLNCQYSKPIDISNAFAININFWAFHQDPRNCPQSRNPDLKRKVHAHYNTYGSIHFIMEDDQIEHFILQPAAYGLNREMTMNFKQAIASQCNLTLSEVNEKWPSDQIKLPVDETKLKCAFGVGLEIWCRRSKKCSKEVTDTVPTLIYKSRFKNHIKLLADYWSDDKTVIKINEPFVLTYLKMFQCPQDFCLFATTNRQRFDKHCESCKDETIVDYEQRNLLEDDIVKWMIEERFLTKRPKIDAKHVHYDIETMLKPFQTSSGKTVCFGEERIVSIGASDNISDRVRSQIFARENLDEESLVKMIHDFWTHLLQLREEFRKTLPTEVNNAFFKIQTMLFPKQKDVFGKTITLPLSDPLKVKLRSAYNYLDGLRSLKVVGWNSENFGMDSIFLVINCFFFNCMI